MIVVNARFLTQEITGVQRYSIEISKQLHQLNRELVFLAPRNIRHHDTARELNVRTCGINRGHLWEQVDLPLTLKKMGNPLLLNLAARGPMFYQNQVITIHDMSPMVDPGWFSGSFNWYYRNVFPILVKHARRIITVSSFSKQEIHRYLNIEPERIAVVYGAPGRCFASRPSTTGSQEKPSDIVLSVSSLNPRKNLNRLIQAFMQADLPDMRLIVVGTGHASFRRDRGHTQSAGDGRIEFMGRVSDAELAELYGKARFFVFPSLYEGFGLPPLEAMSCGCPVICSNRASMPEICGDAALWVDGMNTAELAGAMKKLDRDGPMREELRQKGFHRVKAFSWENSALRLLDELEHLQADME